MKAIGLAAFAVLALLSAKGDDAALKKEHALLQGKWTITNAESAKGNEDGPKGAVVEFLKDRKGLEFTKGDQTKKGIYTINPAGKPKEITFAPGDGDVKMEGIYKVEKDTLTICISPNAAQDGRPTEFAVKEGKGFVLVTLERAK